MIVSIVALLLPLAEVYAVPLDQLVGAPRSGDPRIHLRSANLILAPGEAAEFDTYVPHWLGPDGDQPVELLVLFGREGERAHLTARTT